jgi:large subunit ribosomal protein L18
LAAPPPGGLTLASASTRHKSTPGRDTLGANVQSAKKVGTLAAEAAKAKGISAIVFDRNGALYHGKVKALADAAREAGLQF